MRCRYFLNTKSQTTIKNSTFPIDLWCTFGPLAFGIYLMSEAWCLVFSLRVNWPEQCAVIIPCRNEARFIATLVWEIRTLLPNVIVVNDASTDATAQLASVAGAEVISHEYAQGKGAALRTGWNRAHARGFAWALCMDGDGQHAAADIPEFLEGAERSNSSLVVGNRMTEANKMPFVRRVVNRWMSRKLSVLAGRELPDSQCGFRLLRLAALNRVQLRATQFEIESEQLLAFIGAWRASRVRAGASHLPNGAEQDSPAARYVALVSLAAAMAGIFRAATIRRVPK